MGLGERRCSCTESATHDGLSAPVGATVRLDGVALAAADFTALGDTGYALARKGLAHHADGFHTVVGDRPVGVYVYGYGQYTSYWYPAGAK